MAHRRRSRKLSSAPRKQVTGSSPAVRAYKNAKAAEKLMKGKPSAAACDRADSHIEKAYLALKKLPKGSTTRKMASKIVGRAQNRSEIVCDFING